YLNISGGAQAERGPGMYFNIGAGAGISLANYFTDALPALLCADNQFVSAIGVSALGGSSVNIDGVQQAGSISAFSGATRINLFFHAGTLVAHPGTLPFQGYIAEAVYFNTTALPQTDINYLRASHQTYFGTT
ncbi:MAG TPA: hypothetical protein VGH25_16715, partial [Dongiaceae bacterium]